MSSFYFKINNITHMYMYTEKKHVRFLVVFKNPQMFLQHCDESFSEGFIVSGLLLVQAAHRPNACVGDNPEVSLGDWLNLWVVPKGINSFYNGAFLDLYTLVHFAI